MLTLAVSARAAIGDEATATPSDSERIWRLDQSLIGTGTGAVVADDSLYNPSNQVLELPFAEFRAEYRPNFNLEYGEKWRLVARPRVRGILDFKEVNGDSKSANKIKANVTEAFATYSPTASVQISAGRQNFQWGPAETFNPSNRLFPEVRLQVAPYEEYVGRYIVRGNLTAGEHWNAIGIAELADNREPEARYGDEFGAKGLAKVEYAWNGGASYFGLVGGAGGKNDRSWIGEYFAWTLNNAIQFYFDVSHTQGSDTWRPVVNSMTSFVDMLQSHRGSHDIFTFGVAGLRYTTPGGSEFRFEYIQNDDGLTDSEQNKVLESFLLPRPESVLNLRKSLQTGSPLPGKRYLYGSARFIVRGQQDYLALRTMYSPTDSSTFTSLTLQLSAFESGTVYLVAGVAAGLRDSELKRSTDGFGTIAYQWSF
jgi:hypothetical protein